jgi:hypothetical protein
VAALLYIVHQPVLHDGLNVAVEPNRRENTSHAGRCSLFRKHKLTYLGIFALLLSAPNPDRERTDDAANDPVERDFWMAV